MSCQSIVLLIILSCLASALFGATELPSVFGNHMVLQRDKPIPVWGWSEEGLKVKVTLGGKSATATAGKDGRWEVRLPAMKASGEGRELIVEGSEKIVFKDVLVGEVWVCSGQSNMEWSVNGALNPNEEKQAADYPKIRHIKVPKIPSDSHERDFNARWQVCSPSTAGGFTAVGYYFARALLEKLNVPVGLVNSSWGGTRIEPWMPLEGYRMIGKQGFARDTIKRIEAVDPSTEEGKARHLAGIEVMRDWIKKAEHAVDSGKFPPPRPASAQVGIGQSHQDPTRLYRGMIHPLVPYAIRGAIWYQGESNGNEGETYYHKMHGLVKGWRKVWNQGDFPFYWVQLANFTNDRKTPQGGDGYARIREAERRALDIPNSGMAVIIDIGETSDIHPKNKQDVGKRLAQWALAETYEFDVVASGPLYETMKIEGGKARILFKNVGKGLIIGRKQGLEDTEELVIDAKLERFAIAGKDKTWVWAEAVIDGDTVLVSHPDVPVPVAVRYAYSANPLGANLYNREGFPASPFRTDDW